MRGHAWLPLLVGGSLLTQCLPVCAILAGGEFDLPSDSPSSRLDTDGIYSFVGALEIASGGYNYYGSASALSPHWVLTAGHNVDFNDDGLVDDGLAVNLHLPGFGSYSASSYSIHPDFAGFGNPSIHHWRLADGSTDRLQHNRRVRSRTRWWRNSVPLRF